MSMKYYSTQRPIGPGTIPWPTDGNSIVNIMNYDERQYVAEIDREAWGSVTYASALDPAEASHYKLLSVTDAMAAKETRWSEFKRCLGLVAEKADPVFGERLMTLLETDIGRLLVYCGSAKGIIDYTIWRRKDVAEAVDDYNYKYGNGNLTDEQKQAIIDDVVDYLEGKVDCEGHITQEDIDLAVDTAIEEIG